VPEVLVIAANGEKLGVMNTDQAVAMAEDIGLDLVEVSPKARPPVCRIMDYGKYKYEQHKRGRGTTHRRAGELKGMRMSPKIGEHDFQVKARHVLNFLKDGNKVRVAMWFRGREMAHPRVGEVLLHRLAETVQEVGSVEMTPRLEGRNMIMILTPKKS